MTATSVTQTLHANHPSLKAATCIQPLSFSLGRQLHHAFRPASAQLQRTLRSPPPLRAPQATPAQTVVTAAADASKVASGNAARVKAAFAEAGLSQDAIHYILTQYPAYKRWDVEQKLLPAMQRKQQELGAGFPSAMRRTPKMLLRSTEISGQAQSARKAAKAKAASGNAPLVKAAFAEAGLSRDAIDHILAKYPHYLRWDVEQKLLPAMQCWQQDLDEHFISEFARIPHLLLKKPEEEQLKDQYVMSIGIKLPEVIRKRHPFVFSQSLTSMKSKVAVLQQCGFTGAQTSSLIEQHAGILQCSSDNIEEVLRVIGDMFGCAERETLCDVLLSCRDMRLFTISPAALHHNFTYFSNCIGGNDKEMQRAWKNGVFRTSPAELDTRLDSIAAQLDSTLDEAKRLVRRHPEISNFLPATVALHVTQLHDLGFSRPQVKSMCLGQPSMLALSYDSQNQADKWASLTCVLRLSHDAIAACPHLLMSSLPNRLGPRWAYLQQLRSHDVIAFTAASQLLKSLVSLTDMKFRAAYTTPQLRVYDEHFQKQWLRGWDSLLVDQQLSIQEIGDNPALMHASMKDISDPISS